MDGGWWRDRSIACCRVRRALMGNGRRCDVMRAAFCRIIVCMDVLSRGEPDRPLVYRGGHSKCGRAVPADAIVGTCIRDDGSGRFFMMPRRCSSRAFFLGSLVCA